LISCHFPFPLSRTLSSPSVTLEKKVKDEEAKGEENQENARVTKDQRQHQSTTQEVIPNDDNINAEYQGQHQEQHQRATSKDNTKG
jgi:hypothetical protein